MSFEIALSEIMGLFALFLFPFIMFKILEVMQIRENRKKIEKKLQVNKC